MPASRAARITATPSSREIRSNVRHDPSAMIETSMPEPPSGRWGSVTSAVATNRPHTCRR